MPLADILVFMPAKIFIRNRITTVVCLQPVTLCQTSHERLTSFFTDTQISDAAIRVGAGVGGVVIIASLLVLIVLTIIFVILKRKMSIKYASFK